jgi:hypothetical protein
MTRLPQRATASLLGAALMVAGTAAALALSAVEGPEAPRITAQRFAENPLVTTRTSASLGDNINGPTVIRVPAWVERPLGRYYMYFAHHMGMHIRLAYADRLEGPWRIHEPGVLPVASTAFHRPQPDPPENLENFYTHVASPEIFVDESRRRLLLWVHGWYTNGQRWPVGEAAARDWARQNGYGQYTQVAESANGLQFEVRPAVTRASYLRVFRHENLFYGMARLGQLLRSKDPMGVFDNGPNPFREGPYANRVRHVAVAQRAATLVVFFTAIGDNPERVIAASIDRTGDWSGWRVSEAVDVLRPEAPYECPNLPSAPSVGGDVKEPVRQLRDPAIFEEDGRTFLFYSFCGEQGIAGAELTFANAG